MGSFSRDHFRLRLPRPLPSASVLVAFVAACALAPSAWAVSDDSNLDWEAPMPVIAPTTPGPGCGRVVVPVVVTDGQGWRVQVRHATGETRVEVLPRGGAEAAEPTWVRPSARPSTPPAVIIRGQEPETLWPPERDVMAHLAPTWLSEQYVPGGLDVAPGMVVGAAASGIADLGLGAFAGGRLSRLAYTLDDTQISGSRHKRTELEGLLTGGWRYPLGSLRLGASAGWWARYLSVENTYPLSLTTPLVSVPNQLFHGPRLGVSADYLLSPTLKLSLAVEVSPYVWASGEDAVLALGPLYGYSAAPGVTWQPIPGLVATAAYRYDSLNSTGVAYSSTRNGPWLGLGWRI